MYPAGSHDPVEAPHGSNARTCQHVRAVTGSIGRVQDESDKPARQVESEAHDRAILARVNVPVFVVEGLPGVLAGWTEPADDAPVQMVLVRHEHDEDEELSIDVDTERCELDSEAMAARCLAYVGGETSPTSMLGDHDRRRGVRVKDVHLRVLANPTELLEADVPEYRPSKPRRGATAVRGVLDKRSVVELAETTRIEDLATTLADTAQPGLALLVSDDAQRSWLGGRPQLSADTAWPCGTHGAMTFIAQLRLPDLDASVWIGPPSGYLHIFCDVDPESNSIEGAGACAIVHTPAGTEVSVREWPDDLHDHNRLAQRAVTARPGLTLPDADAPLIAPLGLGFGGDRGSDLGELWKLQQRLRARQGWRDAAGQVLGWPTWQNDDGTGYLASLGDAQELEWTLLLQTDALDAELYVLLPTEDLTAARFDRAQATIEHD